MTKPVSAHRLCKASRCFTTSICLLERSMPIRKLLSLMKIGKAGPISSTTCSLRHRLRRWLSCFGWALSTYKLCKSNLLFSLFVAKALSAFFGLLCSADPPVLWQGHDLIFFDILLMKNFMGDGLPLGLGPVPLFQVLSRAMLLGILFYLRGP